MKTNHRKKKRAAIIVAILALIATTMGGTYAYQDYQQHKSNELNGGSAKYEARLVEDFSEVDNWVVGDGPVVKKISVANLGTAPEYGKVYVRIQLREYMEIGELAYQETAKRYMIDIDGEFIMFENESQAIAATSAVGPFAGHIYAELTDAVTGKSGYFIETKDRDPNGQMGKYVITGYAVGDPAAVIANGPQHKAASTNHHAFPSEECDYAIHSWKQGAVLETRDYIEWQLNTGSIITLSEWLDPAGAYKGAPVAKWVIDDRNDEGWVYWGSALEPDSVTELFMESVKLTRQPDGSFYYVIHTDMQAVSIDELITGGADWGEAGEAFIDNQPPGGGNGGDDGNGGDPGSGGTDPNGGNGGTEEPDVSLPVKEDSGDGYSPIRDVLSPMDGDGLFVKIFYPDLTDANNNKYYHDGAIHLEDVITDGNYSGVTATAIDAKYRDYIKVGIDQHGKLSIIYSYVPTEQDYRDWAGSHELTDDICIPIQVNLVRDDGKAAIITINMYYWDSSITV